MHLPSAAIEPTGSTRCCSPGAIMVKIRDGAVANRLACIAVGVSLEGERDLLGLWAGTAPRSPYPLTARD